MQLERSFFEHYCVNMSGLKPGTIKNYSSERKHPFLTKFVLLMTSRFNQYSTPLVNYVNVAQQINPFRQKRLVFCHFQIHSNIVEVYTVSAKVHDNFWLVCISLEDYKYFNIKSILAKNIIHANQFFHCVAIVAF